MAAALVAASRALQVGRGGAGQAGHLGRHLEQRDLAVLQLGDIGGAGGGDLVEPVGAMDDPGALGAELASTSAIGSIQAWAKTPTKLALARPAGLESGPIRLKMVRVPSSTRVGPTWRMAL